MWPWEHVVVGYVAYSLFCHLVLRDSPGGWEAGAVVFGSLFPDLIDKPLAWQFGVFEGGYAIVHSVFFAVPISIAVGLIARRYGAGRVGLAFGIGYLIHLPSDLLPPYVRRGELVWERVLWPVQQAGEDGHRGLVEGFIDEFVPFAYELVAGDPSGYMLFQLGLMGCAFLLWLYDGVPIFQEVVLELGRQSTEESG
jgi:hypothetical protein